MNTHPDVMGTIGINREYARLFYLLFAIYLLILLVTLQPAFAQSPAAFWQKQSRPKPAALRDYEYRLQHLTAPADLPNLPPYSGRCTYMRGTVLPNVAGGPTFNMHFDAAEDAETVLNWYRSVFSARPWTVDVGGSNQRTAAAVDQTGNTCQVVVLSSYRQGRAFRTSFMIQYKASKA